MNQYFAENLIDQAAALRRNADILESAANGMNEKEIAKKVDRSVSRVRYIISEAYRTAACNLRNNIVALYEAGYSESDIADELNLTESTVRNYIHRQDGGEDE